MNLFKYHKNPESLRGHKKFTTTTTTWYLWNLLGEQTWSYFDDAHGKMTFVDSDTGIKIINWGDDEDNEGAAERGDEDRMFWAYARGTQYQIVQFINRHFDGGKHKRVK